MADPVQVASELVPLVEREAATSEQIATMPQPVVDAFREARLFALQVPTSLGGYEADFETALRVYEIICRADASTGWSLLANASTSGFASTFCGDDAIAVMFGDGKLPTHAGQFSPRGTSVANDGGYIIAGKYSFGSGSAHAEWIGGGTLELVDGSPRMITPERPAIRAFFVPRDHVEFTGNWDVMGLVGTGSFDYTVPEQVVDASFTFDLIGDSPQRGAPMYRIGVLGLAAIGHAGFALGVGRRALDEIAVLAPTKQRLGAMSILADQERFQYELGHHDAAMRAARALVFDVFGDAQRRLDAGDDLDAGDLVPVRQATTYATDVAGEVVRFAYLASGTDGLRNPSVIGRCFRDIHAATQHMVVDPSTIAQSGRALLDR
jgi:alkylation response protein AidB-like acyl-CoA dehydrogenase